jgi:predicted DCC family thiol-disulfide oxidoreductase YuxK
MKTVLYDGECVFCNSSVAFIWKRDPGAIFTFAKIQSSKGQELLKARGVFESDLDTFYLLDGDHVFVKGDAAFRVGMLLEGWSFIAKLLNWMPSCIKNWQYDVIARNRSKFSPKKECSLPPIEIRPRFLDLD